MTQPTTSTSSPDANVGPNEKHLKMMATGTGYSVTVQSDTGKTSSGQVRIMEYDKKARMRRAVKFWLSCWGLSLLLIPIPLIHFTVVPALLIIGPVGAWVISTQGSQVLGGESKCPDCGAFLPLTASPDNWPLKDLCAQCQRRMKIHKV